MVRIPALILLLVFMFVTSSATAEANGLPLAGGEKTVMSGECQFTMNDMFKGRLSLDPGGPASEQHAFYLADFDKGKTQKNLHIVFGCKVATDAQDAERICKKSAGLIQNDGNWISAHITSQDQVSISSAANSKSIKIDNSDARGGIYIASDTDGAMQYRLRTLQFCMISNKAALWGGAVVDHAPYNTRHSTEDQAIQLIKSIKFGQAE